MKNILITGGAGFIGTNLVKKLLDDKNNNIYVIDNLITGQYVNAFQFFENENYNFQKLNINEIDDSGVEFNEIYNLACPASPKHYQGDNAIFTLKTSFIGNLNLLELAKKFNSKILFSSTSEIYGDPQIHPQTENYNGNVNSVGPRSCYDEGKRCAETLFYEYNKNYNIDTKIVRIFNTYGPYMNPTDGRVIPNFIIQALNDDDITIYGNGLQTRSFCYVSDMVDGLIKVMKKNNYNKPINLGNPHEITIIELAYEIKKLIGSKSDIIFKDKIIDEPIRRKPDISKAMGILNWKPEVTLNDGLNETIGYLEVDL